MDYGLSPRSVITLGLSGYWADARTPDESLQSYMVGLRYFYSIDPLFELPTPGAWLLGVNGSLETTDYDGPNPVVNPGVTQQDVEWIVGAQAIVPVTDSTSAIAILQRHDIDSNLPNFETSNTSAWLGLSWHF